MVFSYFVNEETTNIPHIINKFSSFKIDSKCTLVTTEHGAWVVLDNKEYQLLKDGKLNEDLNLFTALEDKGIIVTDKNVDKIAQMYRDRFHYLFNGISLHIVVPTLRCNQKCIYCHANSMPSKAKGYDMDKKTAKAVVDFIFQTPSPFVTIEFQGGEPLLNFDVLQYIIEYAKQKNGSKSSDASGWHVGKKTIDFTVATNFTTMNYEKLEFLIENNIRLSTSLDGPKRLHDKNRPFSGGSSYKLVTKWIDVIKNEFEYPLFDSALPTISKHSLPYAKQIVDEYVKWGFKHMRMRQLNIAGIAASEWDKVGYTAEEFVEFWKKYLDYVLRLNEKKWFVDDDTVFMLRRILTLKPPLNACLGAPCGACTIQAAYNQWGDVFTCDEARSCEVFKLGNVKQNTYRQVFTSKEALNFVGLTSMVSSACDNCVWHPFCSPCLVSSYGSQKNVIPKLPSDFLCNIRKSQTEYVFRKLLGRQQDILLRWCAGSSF